MNFLFHLYLSGDDPDLMTGNLMGDFVKGRVGIHYPEVLRQGILLHRKIDVFAQTEPMFCRSKKRIRQDFGLWRGILVDLYYDHFLATEWHKWSAVPFEKYIQQAQLKVEANIHYLPERLQEMLPVIFRELLPSYQKVEGIGLALARMSRRVSRANPLADGERELVKNYLGLREDFHQFLPRVRKFSEDYLQKKSDSAGIGL